MDIDSQAVEVTKLSLLLKVLEGESDATVYQQLALFHERALPDLAENIKCGNSLIGTDYSGGYESSVNPFDWETEFAEVMNRGGFDIVIGNPPYDVMEKERGASSWPHAALLEYCADRPEYAAAVGGKKNLFRFFMVRGVRLTRRGGRYGMIVPLAVLADYSQSRIRRFMLEHLRETVAACFPQKDNARRRLFRKAKLSTAIITGERAARAGTGSAEVQVRVYPWNQFTDPAKEAVIRLSDSAAVDAVGIPIPLADQLNWDLCRRIHAQRGVVALGRAPEWRVTRGEINQTTYRTFITEDPRMTRMIKGVEVGAFHLNAELSQGFREWFNEAKFLQVHDARPVVGTKRIATQRITGIDEARRVVACIIDPPAYFADSTNSVELRAGSHYRLDYLVAILNSALIQWRFKLTSTNNNVGTNELEALPLLTIDFDDPDSRAIHDRLAGLAQLLARLYRTLEATTIPQQRVILERRIATTMREIDMVVFAAYGVEPSDMRLIL